MVENVPRKGNIPSLKLRRSVHYNSYIERDFIFYLEFWKHVTWYQEQPDKLEWQFDDGLLIYNPDFLIIGDDFREIAECKPESKLYTKQALRQRRVGQTWCDFNDHQFTTYTDTYLRKGHILNNIKLFWRYRLLELSMLKVTALLKNVEDSSDGILVKDLCQQLSTNEVSPVVIRTHICNQIFHHNLTVNLNNAFGWNSVIKLEVA